MNFVLGYHKIYMQKLIIAIELFFITMYNKYKFNSTLKTKEITFQHFI